MEASKEGRSLADFRYGCVGYSVYSDMKNNSGDAQESEKELPVCVGIEVLVDRKVTNANSAPTHAHNKDTHAVPQPRVSRPAQGQSAADDFFSRQVFYVSLPLVVNRFTRNATVVASGVAKNVRKVGNQIKESVDDILYPYRRRPKEISQLVQSNGKRLFLVDTLALVRRLEGQGVPSKQAEAITSAITEVLNDSLENVAQSFVSKGEMQRIEMTQDGNLGKFKSQVQSSQENHFSLLQRETEKLRNDIEKMRSELRYEIDKVTAGQRLDLNLERGRIRDELANQNQETANLTNKLDREIHSLRAQLEAAKYDVIKYCIGTLVSISAVGLAVLRILM
ncbi:coiled-coil domain-containing protein 90-like protein [Artemisia annua]|uniref:Coiled-coil domain-containing protein 90-like protein n=1 Tax=Artemisia annua TaxID=35608 RepID=A0A2U1N3Y9_ARTAN|nr:coiled-coil domain-containing protein 90-like protein [Artemisia annua]